MTEQHQLLISHQLEQHEQATTRLQHQHHDLIRQLTEEHDMNKIEHMAQNQADGNSLRAQVEEAQQQLAAQQTQHDAELDSMRTQQLERTADLELQLQTAMQVRTAIFKAVIFAD